MKTVEDVFLVLLMYNSRFLSVTIGFELYNWVHIGTECRGLSLKKVAVRRKDKKMRKSKACFLIHAFYLYIDSVWNPNLFQMLLLVLLQSFTLDKILSVAPARL